MLTEDRTFVRLAAALLVLSVAAPASLAGDTTATVTNTAPVILSVSLPSTNLTPTAGGTTSTTLTVTVEDLNGCADIMRVDVQVNDTAGATHRGPTNLSVGGYDSCSAGTATYTWAFNMQYYDAPALAINSQYYKVWVVVEDKAGATTNNLLDIGSLLQFNYQELAALNLNVTTLDFGNSISPNSTSNTKQLGVENYGNVQIDASLSGANLSHAAEPAWIQVGYLNYSTAKNMSGKTSLTSTATTLSTFDLARGSGSSKTVYWALSVPSGDQQWVPSGTYTGTMTVSATKG